MGVDWKTPAESCTVCRMPVHPAEYEDRDIPHLYHLVRDGVRGPGGAYRIPCGVVHGVALAVEVCEAHQRDIEREKGLVTEVYAGTNKFAAACSAFAIWTMHPRAWWPRSSGG